MTDKDLLRQSLEVKKEAANTIKELQQSNRELQQELERIMQVHDCQKNSACVKVHKPLIAYIEQCKICGEVLNEYGTF